MRNSLGLAEGIAPVEGRTQKTPLKGSRAAFAAMLLALSGCSDSDQKQEAHTEDSAVPVATSTEMVEESVTEADSVENVVENDQMRERPDHWSDSAARFQRIMIDDFLARNGMLRRRTGGYVDQSALLPMDIYGFIDLSEFDLVNWNGEIVDPYEFSLQKDGVWYSADETEEEGIRISSHGGSTYALPESLPGTSVRIEWLSLAGPAGRMKGVITIENMALPEDVSGEDWEQVTVHGEEKSSELLRYVFANMNRGSSESREPRPPESITITRGILHVDENSGTISYVADFEYNRSDID